MNDDQKGPNLGYKLMSEFEQGVDNCKMPRPKECIRPNNQPVGIIGQNAQKTEEIAGFQVGVKDTRFSVEFAVVDPNDLWIQESLFDRLIFHLYHIIHFIYTMIQYDTAKRMTVLSCS